jgi:hypothetical protein
MTTIRQMILADQIAGHEKTISTYTQAIADLVPQAKGDPLVDALINQYASIIRILVKEWKEMNNEICNISNRDLDFTHAYGGDRILTRSAHLQRSAYFSPHTKPTL